jgi:hypothetical protein
MCVTLSRGLSFRWYCSEAEEQTFFRDMCITLHLDGLNVMPQSYMLGSNLYITFLLISNLNPILHVTRETVQ